MTVEEGKANRLDGVSADGQIGQTVSFSITVDPDSHLPIAKLVRDSRTLMRFEKRGTRLSNIHSLYQVEFGNAIVFYNSGAELAVGLDYMRLGTGQAYGHIEFKRYYKDDWQALRSFQSGVTAVSSTAFDCRREGGSQNDIYNLLWEKLSPEQKK